MITDTQKEYFRNSIETKILASYPEITDVYWVNELKQEPKKPYVVLALMEEEQVLRPDDDNETLTTYNVAHITIGTYTIDEFESNIKTGGVSGNSKARGITNTIWNYLLQRKTVEDIYFNSELSIDVTDFGDIRDLSLPDQAGYTYRYEFDMSVGYNNIYDTSEGNLESKDVNLDDFSLKIT